MNGLKRLGAVLLSATPAGAALVGRAPAPVAFTPLAAPVAALSMPAASLAPLAFAAALPEPSRPWPTDGAESLIRALSRTKASGAAVVGAPERVTGLVGELEDLIARGHAPALAGRALRRFETGAFADAAPEDFEEAFAGLLERGEAEREILFIDRLDELLKKRPHVVAALKPALARARLAVIAGTTPQGYWRYIRDEVAFARRLSAIDLR